MKTKQEHLIELEEDLAPWLPREQEMGRILSGAAAASMTLDQEIEDVDNGLNIREASTKKEVVKASQELDIQPRNDETLEEFKRRVLQKYNSLTVDGSPSGILESISNLFNSNKENIKIKNVDGEPVFEVEILADELDPKFGTVNSTLKLALDLTAANYALNFFREGDLDYISKSDYNSNNYDSSKGYATVDSDGNVTSGGTYSGYYFKV